VLKREAEHNPFSWGKALALFKLPSFSVGLLNIFLTAFPMQILTVFTVTWLVDDRGFTNSQAILFTLVGLFGLTGGSVTGGLVGDRLAHRSERARLAGGHIAWLCFTISLALLLAVRWESNVAYIILLFAVGFFIEYSWTGTIKPVLSKVQLPEVRSTGFALVNAIDSLGRVILAALIGAVADQMGLTLPLLWLGVGASLLNLLAYIPLYFTLTRDSDSIQVTLAARAAAEAPESGA
jgi:predicted MFS family arabinose efflux permease